MSNALHNMTEQELTDLRVALGAQIQELQQKKHDIQAELDRRAKPVVWVISGAGNIESQEKVHGPGGK